MDRTAPRRGDPATDDDDAAGQEDHDPAAAGSAPQAPFADGFEAV